MDFSIIDNIIKDSKSYSKHFNKQEIVNNIVAKYN